MPIYNATPGALDDGLSGGGIPFTGWSKPRVDIRFTFSHQT
jgi:hypothetical protein